MTIGRGLPHAFVQTSVEDVLQDGLGFRQRRIRRVQDLLENVICREVERSDVKKTTRHIDVYTTFVLLHKHSVALAQSHIQHAPYSHCGTNTRRTQCKKHYFHSAILLLTAGQYDCRIPRYHDKRYHDTLYRDIVGTEISFYTFYLFLLNNGKFDLTESSEFEIKIPRLHKSQTVIFLCVSIKI